MVTDVFIFFQLHPCFPASRFIRGSFSSGVGGLVRLAPLTYPPLSALVSRRGYMSLGERTSLSQLASSVGRRELQRASPLQPVRGSHDREDDHVVTTVKL